MTLTAPEINFYSGIPSRGLPTSWRYHYAQALAEALYRNLMMPAEPRRFTEPPKFWTTGSSPGKPKLCEAFAAPFDRAGIPAARILLGGTFYQDALDAMTDEQREAWWSWSKRKVDKWERPVSPAALFRPSGHRVVPNTAHSTPAEREAALILLDYARIDRLE